MRPPIVPVPRLKQSTDGSGGAFTEIVISDDCDEALFAYLAATLQEQLTGSFSQKATGLDEAYWDLDVGEAKIVLHLQVYLGIYIHPAGLSQASQENRDLLVRAYDVVREISART